MLYHSLIRNELFLMLQHIRMFTAGDSSDVHAVVDFVSRSRPWTTIMAIGWGYGANMLAKYLGEEASATPVTAAVCINNPFDLEESTKEQRKYKKKNK